MTNKGDDHMFSKTILKKTYTKSQSDAYLSDIAITVEGTKGIDLEQVIGDITIKAELIPLGAQTRFDLLKDKTRIATKTKNKAELLDIMKRLKPEGHVSETPWGGGWYDESEAELIVKEKDAGWLYRLIHNEGNKKHTIEIINNLFETDKYTGKHIAYDTTHYAKITYITR